MLAAGVVLGAATGYAVSSGNAERGVLLLAVVLAPFVAMALGQVRRLLLAAVIIDIPLQWDTNINWRPEAAELGATAGLSLSITTLALGGLYALWLGESLAGARREATPSGTRLAWPLLVYVGFSALSLIVASDTQLAQFKLFVLVQSLLVFIYIAGTVRSVREIRFVVNMLLAALLVQGMLVVVGRFAGFDLAFAGLSSRVDAEGERFAGTVGSPTTAAAFFSFLLAPAVAVLLSNAGRRSKRLAGAALAAGTVALVLTLSRAGWISAVIAILLLVSVAVGRRWLRPRALLVGAALLVVVLLPFAGAIGERVGGDDQGSAQSRLPLMELAFDVIRDQPVTGVGLNNFSTAIPDYAGARFTGEFVFAAHNKYLLVWSEAGLLALLAFLTFLVVTLRRGWRAGRSGHPYAAPVALGLTFAIVGQMVHMLVDIFQSRPQVQLLWVAAALIAAMAALPRREGDDAAPTEPAPATAPPLGLATAEAQRG